MSQLPRIQPLLASRTEADGVDAAALPAGHSVLGTVMWLHLVGYSKHATAQQVAVKEHFNELLTKALKGTDSSLRLVMDTNDGAASCFLGDPEEALQSALLLRGLLLQKYRQMLSLRIGLHLGPVRRVIDSRQQVKVIGDGINVAQRIADFARPNQILVSRAFHDVITALSDHAAGLFSALGPHLDPHLRSHDIHAVLDPQSRPAPVAPARNTEFENTASFAALATLTPELVAEVESELTKNIGPLARVLVKKALTRSVSAQGLRELLAVSIPDLSARELFVNAQKRGLAAQGASDAATGAGRRD